MAGDSSLLLLGKFFDLVICHGGQGYGNTDMFVLIG